MISPYFLNCEQLFTPRSLYGVVTLGLKEPFFSSYCIGGRQVLTKPAIGGQWEAGIEHMYAHSALRIGRETSAYLYQEFECAEVVLSEWT